jgi:hypothetical protein
MTPREFFIEKVVEIFVMDREDNDATNWDEEITQIRFRTWAEEEDVEIPTPAQCKRYVRDGEKEYLERNPGAKINYAEPEAEGFSTDRADTDQEPDEYVQDSEFPNYATNWDGTVISLGGPRQKKGARMAPTFRWAKTDKGRFYPQAYYRLTKDKERVEQTHGQLLERRSKKKKALSRGIQGKPDGIQ